MQVPGKTGGGLGLVEGLVEGLGDGLGLWGVARVT